MTTAIQYLRGDAHRLSAFLHDPLLGQYRQAVNAELKHRMALSDVEGDRYLRGDVHCLWSVFLCGPLLGDYAVNIDR